MILPNDKILKSFLYLARIEILFIEIQIRE